MRLAVQAEDRLRKWRPALNLIFGYRLDPPRFCAVKLRRLFFAARERKDRSASKPQRNGVRPSSGAGTSDGYRCESNPEPQTWLTLLRPGTAAHRKFIAACEQVRQLQRKDRRERTKAKTLPVKPNPRIPPNAPAQSRRANGLRLPTEGRTRRCLQPVCWALDGGPEVWETATIVESSPSGARTSMP